jgi:hypothetical protein
MATMRRRSPLLIVAILTLFASRAAAAQEGLSATEPRTGLGTELATETRTELPDNPTPKQDQAAVATPEKKGAPGPIGLIARRSFFYPELATTPGALTTKEKFELFLTKSISPPQLLGSLASAGVTQAIDRFPGYGQGGTGFADRFGSSMGTGASSNFFGTFIVASMLHEDPRYFPRVEGSFRKRLGYAISRVVVTRKDSGGETFNWWGTTGQLAAEGLANSYLPYAERHVGKTLERFGIRIGFSAANNVLKEYWPTIFKSLGLNKVAPGLKPDPPTPGQPQG